MSGLAGAPAGESAASTAATTAATEAVATAATEAAAQQAAEEQMQSMAIENAMLTQGEQLGGAQGGGGATAGGVVGGSSAATGKGGFSKFIQNNVENAKFRAGDEGYKPSGMGDLFNLMGQQMTMQDPMLTPEQNQFNIWQALMQRGW